MLLSKSMEKTFRLLKNKAVRKEYVEAELLNGVSHQIRVLRQERGWSQTVLARRLKTTQGVVSRLEDPSYGRYSIKTLLELGAVFDVAFFARFLPFSKFMQTTWDTREENFVAAPYSEEVKEVQFFEEASATRYFEPHNVETQSDLYFKALFIADKDKEASKELPSPSFNAVNAAPTAQYFIKALLVNEAGS